MAKPPFGPQRLVPRCHFSPQQRPHSMQRVAFVNWVIPSQPHFFDGNRRFLPFFNRNNHVQPQQIPISTATSIFHPFFPQSLSRSGHTEELHHLHHRRSRFVLVDPLRRAVRGGQHGHFGAGGAGGGHGSLFQQVSKHDTVSC